MAITWRSPSLKQNLFSFIYLRCEICGTLSVWMIQEHQLPMSLLYPFLITCVTKALRFTVPHLIPKIKDASRLLIFDSKPPL